MGLAAAVSEEGSLRWMGMGGIGGMMAEMDVRNNWKDRVVES